VKGYNPHKPGRPSHTCHPYMIANQQMAIVDEANSEQLRLSFAEVTDEVTVYEYTVLVTWLGDDVLAIAQHYRDRADCENNFDELKNHWGWGGFTTRHLKRCQFMARMTALVYDWWSLFVRLANPDKHTESITSRPLLLLAPARLTRHGGQTRVTISHSHADIAWVEDACRALSAFLGALMETAEQLTPVQRWCRVLSPALVKYLHGRQLNPPDLLPAPG